MKGLTKKLTATIALAALFSLTACSQVATNNTGSTGGSGGVSGGASNGSGNGTNRCPDASVSRCGAGGGIVQGFVVQLLASSNASKAGEVKNVFIKEGYKNTTVNTILRNGQSLHRVQIGPFGTQADAQRVLNQMKRRYKKNQYVKSAVVKTIYGQ